MTYLHTFDAAQRRASNARSEELGHRDTHSRPGEGYPQSDGAGTGDTRPDESFRDLVESNPAAILVHESGRIVYVNPAALRWVGTPSPELVLGQLITEFIHPEAILVALTRLTDPDRSVDTEPLTSVMFRADGTTLDVEAITAPTTWAGRRAYQTVLRDISAEKAAQITATQQAALLDYAPDAIIATDADGLVTQWNRAAEKLYGQPDDEVLGRPLHEAVGAPLDLSAIVAAGTAMHATHYTAAGLPLTVRITAAAMETGYLVICAENSSHHFQSVVSSLDRGIVVIRRDGGIASINPAANRILGFGASQFPGAHSDRTLDFPVFDTDGHVIPAAQRPVNVTLRTGQPVHSRILGLRRHDGRQTWISFTTALLDADDVEHSPVLVSLSDVTTEHLTNQQLRHHANHDALTGLPNRTRTLALITAALTPSETPRLAALMFVDIDQLKQVNDSLGHHAGDQVLRTSAERLQGVLRFSDTLTRVGGDEFVVLIAAPANAEDLQNLATRLHDALKNPMTIDGQLVTTSASIGVTIIDTARAVTPADILRRADTAMYQAKSSGPGQTRFYAPRNGNHYRHHAEDDVTSGTSWEIAINDIFGRQD